MRLLCCKFDHFYTAEYCCQLLLETALLRQYTLLPGGNNPKVISKSKQIDTEGDILILARELLDEVEVEFGKEFACLPIAWHPGLPTRTIARRLAYGFHAVAALQRNRVVTLEVCIASRLPRVIDLSVNNQIEMEQEAICTQSSSSSS